MPDTMIERVEHALKIALAIHTDLDGSNEDDVWRKATRAALTAMREPTDAMAKAGLKKSVQQLHHDGGYRMEDAFTAMIDAALAEEG